MQNYGGDFAGNHYEHIDATQHHGSIADNIDDFVACAVQFPFI